jgi:hypothetical protein
MAKLNGNMIGRQQRKVRLNSCHGESCACELNLEASTCFSPSNRTFILSNTASLVCISQNLVNVIVSSNCFDFKGCSTGRLPHLSSFAASCYERKPLVPITYHRFIMVWVTNSVESLQLNGHVRDCAPCIIQYSKSSIPEQWMAHRWHEFSILVCHALLFG